MGFHETASRTDRPSRGYRVAEAVTAAVIVALAVVFQVSFAEGHVLTGLLAAAAAVAYGAALFLLRANWRQKQFARSLVTQNARLLWEIGHPGDDTLTFEREPRR